MISRLKTPFKVLYIPYSYIYGSRTPTWWSAGWGVPILPCSNRILYTQRLAISASQGSTIHFDPLHLCLARMGYRKIPYVYGIQMLALWTVTSGSLWWRKLSSRDGGAKSTLIRRVPLPHALHFIDFHYVNLKFNKINVSLESRQYCICTVNMFVLCHICWVHAWCKYKITKIDFVFTPTK